MLFALPMLALALNMDVARFKYIMPRVDFFYQK